MLNKTIKQYRVNFDVFSLIGDAMRLTSKSTKWFNSEEEALASRWMKETNAKIVTREYTPMPRDFQHLN
jgi:hypothetical protein